MSWSVKFIGKPEAVARAAEEYGKGLKDSESKEEYEKAAPHLAALVRQNFAGEEGYSLPIIILEANGHGIHRVEGENKHSTHVFGSLSASLQVMYGELV